MTYCVGLCLRAGIIMLGDTRTNAGVDNISTFSKLQVIEQPGERVIGICTAGNLAITQAVSGHLQQGVQLDGQRRHLSDVANMFQAAQLVGAAVRTLRRGGWANALLFAVSLALCLTAGRGSLLFALVFLLSIGIDRDLRVERQRYRDHRLPIERKAEA